MIAGHYTKRKEKGSFLSCENEGAPNRGEGGLCGERKSHRRRVHGSSDSDSLRPRSKSGLRQNEFPGPAEAKQGVSSLEVSARSAPRHPHRSTLFRAGRPPASGALLLRGSPAGSARQRSARAGQEVQCGRRDPFFARAPRWHGTGRRRHHRELLAQACSEFYRGHVLQQRRVAARANLSCLILIQQENCSPIPRYPRSRLL
jgi:hypothetical protein